eukprot:TRINITY_DN9009_c0_g1_i1.p1 TRINITY_DN9009_c0_g1~~TRINITY_DN9009_c0_g1_i1.p1  ORF type:complete len:500 (+),score=128.10 TRINITY_DN9009_c0_g1_i1:2-1501(+)
MGTLTVTEQLTASDGTTTVVSSLAATIACRYVRREIRALSQVDRERFLDALAILYFNSDEEGQAKYGNQFVSYERLCAMHDDIKFCYHGGQQFITAHWAFNTMVERSLQSIDPGVSLPYWDFMKDSDQLGSSWYMSEVFDETMFGSAIGLPTENFKLAPSRFRGIRNVYDPTGDRVISPEFNVLRNGFGYITSPTNEQNATFVSRTHTFCGVTGSVALATCRDFAACFESYDSLTDFRMCMETDIHADMHGWLGGGYNCAVDMAQFIQEVPEVSTELVTFALTYIVANTWHNTDYFAPYTECPSTDGCINKSQCSCTCTLDIDSLTDDEVYAWMEEMLLAMTTIYDGADFVTTSNGKLRFAQNGHLLSDAAYWPFLRALMKLGCTPGSVGAMSTGASPADPIFWVLHGIYDKAMHALTLSPSFSDFDLSWTNETCGGSMEFDEQPFSLLDLGMGTSKDYLTNAELVTIATGDGARALTYVYDGYDSWGTCHWDACPSCS